MRNLILSIILFPLTIHSQTAEDRVITSHRQTVEEFITSFYLSHGDTNKMIAFFDPKYFSSFNKFIAHMDLKDDQYGTFIENKVLKVNDKFDGSVIWRRYQVHYRKGSMVEEIELKRISSKDAYQITYWHTARL